MARNFSTKKRHKRKPMADINVVPYIDVMLVLLVIFMMTTPLLSQGVKVDLPKEKAQAIAQKDKEPIIVSVNAQNQYFVNLSAQPNAALDGQAVQTLVHNTLEKDGINSQNPRPVLVKSDQSVRYGDVVKIMVLLQQAGAASVGLVTEQGSDNTTSSSSIDHPLAASGNAWHVA